ncbi:hypothetical protein TNCT1_24670 [Streptomyces sp. 1-11]|nr:hypothetical protein TNCT1_24670 [Streptomyces sp. 1-11]
MSAPKRTTSATPFGDGGRVRGDSGIDHKGREGRRMINIPGGRAFLHGNFRVPCCRHADRAVAGALCECADGSGNVTGESLAAPRYPHPEASRALGGGSGAVARERLGNLRPLTDT